MARVIWTPEALENLEGYRDFYAAAAPEYAEALLTRLVEAVDRLESFPLSGRAVPEMEDAGLRELIVGQFHLVFDVQVENVWIVSVLHGSMDIPSRLRERQGEP